MKPPSTAMERQTQGRANGFATEQWRPLLDYEGRYEVSDLGRIRSLPRVETSRQGYSRTIRGGILRPMVGPWGYLQVSLRKGGKMRTIRLHRLIASTFHADKKNVLHNEVAHLDGDTGNARADNLKWVSKVENHSHKRAHGTLLIGEKHPRAKLTAAHALAIYFRGLSGESVTALGREFGIHCSTARAIRDGRLWRSVTQLNRLSQGARR